MRILITGGTGFVGFHTTRALMEAGHEVQLLARDPSKVKRLYAEAGHPMPDVAVGDVTDASAVERALAGCEGVVHAAAVVALEARRAREVRAVNLRGVELVVGGAHRMGLGPIVYVSSATALERHGAEGFTADAPVARPGGAYARSKAEGERFVRELQAKGAPVVCTYPASVIGPEDPGLSEGNHTVLIFLRDLVVETATGFQVVDVRDLARIHVALLERSRGPGRFMAGGHYVPWTELGDLLDGLTGGRVRRLRVPGGALRAAGRVCDVIKRVVPFDFPLTREAMTLATEWVPADSRATTASLGIAFRPVGQSFGDTLRWLAASGHLDVRRIGRLGHTAGPAVRSRG